MKKVVYLVVLFVLVFGTAAAGAQGPRTPATVSGAGPTLPRQESAGPRPATNGGLLYKTSLDIGDPGFSVYDPATDTWTVLTPYETGAQMAVSAAGQLYAYGYNTGTVDLYDPATDTWSPVSSAPPGATGMYGNLEITNAGEFLYTEPWGTTLWHTVGGVWTTMALPFPCDAMGDYEPATNQYVIGEAWTTNAHWIDLNTWTITSYVSGVGNGEYARFGVVMDNAYWFEADGSPIHYFDLGNPAAPPVNTGTVLGWYSGAAADRANHDIYVASLDGTQLWRYNAPTNTAVPLTGGSYGWHSSLAFTGTGAPPMDPDIEVNPNTLSAEQCADTVTTQTLQICNTGGSDLTWSLSEGAFAGSMPFTPVKVTGGGANPALAVSSPAAPLGKPVPSAHPEAILWDQPLSSVNQNAYVNQDFTDLPTYSSFLADDFVNGEPWNISTIFVPGDGWNGFSSLFNATALTWQIYADNGGVPAGDPSSGGALWSLTLAPTDPQVAITTGSGGMPSNATLNLAGPVNVPAGHWWLVFYPSMPFSGGGQYGRQPADTLNGYWGQFINPGGSFGYGTAWQSWAVIGATQQDIAFRLEGNGGPPDPLPWLSEDPNGGTVPAGECVDVTVTFDSTGLAVGDYFGNLVIDSNDPDEPLVTVPVQLTVVDCNLYPDIDVTPTSLSAEQCPDTITTQTMQVCNTGGADLTWSLSEQPVLLGGAARPAAPKITLPAGAPASLAAWLAAGKPAPAARPVAPSAPAAAPEALSFYASRGTFDGDFPGLPVEGFENGSMGYGTVDVVPHPLDQFSSNLYFDPGDILPGIQFWASTTQLGDEIAVLGQQFMGNPTKTAVANYFTDAYRIVFDPPVQAAGMDLQEFMGSYSCQLDIYTTAGWAGSTTSACNEAGTFWGVASDAEPITEVMITSLGGGAEGADNVAFGGEVEPPPDVPWLSENPTSGTVAPDTCQDVTVTFDSTGLALGDYFANLVVDSNDPDEPTVTVPVHLAVVECADNFMHINRMRMNWRLAGQPGFVKVIALVRIYDQNGAPVVGAEVFGDWTYPDGNVVPGVYVLLTDDLGRTKFRVKEPQFGEYEFCVTGMTLTGYVYDPGANEVPECVSAVTVP